MLRSSYGTLRTLHIIFQISRYCSYLDPKDLGDDALLRRIKFKIEIIDPTEEQWREIWKIMCKVREVPYDDRSIDYLVAKWFRADGRPFRMCQPRDILDQLISIARYNMETPLLTADLLDAACLSYFPSKEKKNFGAKVRLDLYPSLVGVHCFCQECAKGAASPRPFCCG